MNHLTLLAFILSNFFFMYNLHTCIQSFRFIYKHDNIIDQAFPHFLQNLNKNCQKLPDEAYQLILLWLSNFLSILSTNNHDDDHQTVKHRQQQK